MNYLMLICLCLVLNSVLIQSLRIKVTKAADCTTHNFENFCVQDKNCVWINSRMNNKCQSRPTNRMLMVSNGAGINRVPMSFGRSIE